MKRTSPPSPTSGPPPKRERSQEDKSWEKQNDPFKMFKGESGPEYFNRMLENASQADIYLEYLLFLKSVPDLASVDLDKIKDKVKSELRIDMIEDQISMMELKFSSTAAGHYPIMDALGAKLGFSLRILTPPTNHCLLCDGRLVNRHPERRPTQVSSHIHKTCKRTCSTSTHPSRLACSH